MKKLLLGWVLASTLATTVTAHAADDIGYMAIAYKPAVKSELMNVIKNDPSIVGYTPLPDDLKPPRISWRWPWPWPFPWCLSCPLIDLDITDRYGNFSERYQKIVEQFGLGDYAKQVQELQGQYDLRGADEALIELNRDVALHGLDR